MTQVKPARIDLAIADLVGKDQSKHRAAREVLERVGAPAIDPLIEALPGRDEHARHEILKVLGALGEPAAADTFVEDLDDDNPDRRWLAAEGLVGLGRKGLVRILKELTDYPGTTWKLRGAHHVLSGLGYAGYFDVVAPVLKAFRSKVAQIDLPRAAVAALDELRH